MSSFMSLGSDPEIVEAFEIVTGKREAPLDMRNTSGRGYYWNLLQSAADRVEKQKLRGVVCEHQQDRDTPTTPPRLSPDIRT